MRNSLFKNMASGNVTLYFHMIRSRRPVMRKSFDTTIDPHSASSKDFISYLDDQWKKKYSTTDSYFNELYISILYEPDKQGAAYIEYALSKIKQTSNRGVWERDMKEMYENMQEMTTRILNTMRDYDAELLGVRKEKDGYFCEISEFLGAIVNCGDMSPMMVPRGPLNEYLPTNRLFFGSKSIESRGPSGRKFAGMISVKEYGPSTSAGMFDGFLQMPFELIMTQSFRFANRTIAVNKMQLQKNRMIQAEDKAGSQIFEIDQALDMVVSGKIGLGEHHLTLLCIDDNLKALENTLSVVSVELSNCGLSPVRERINMEPCYWGQLPGNLDYIIRRSII